PITATPPSSAGAVSQTNGPPTRSPLLSTGSPVEVSASAAPTQNAAIPEPSPIIAVQKAAHLLEATLPRYSIPTARAMRPTRAMVPTGATVRGTYRAENSAAYQ